MSHDDPSTNDATKKPPDRGGSSFVRTGSSASLALVLVAGLVGCFGPSSGSLHYEGSDPKGAFSGDVDASYCGYSFEPGGYTSVFFGGAGKSDVIGLDTWSVHVSTRGGGWTLERSKCRALDIRKWFDAEKQLHVVVLLVDCTSFDGVRVQGSVRSDRCHLIRPG